MILVITTADKTKNNDHVTSTADHVTTPADHPPGDHVTTPTDHPPAGHVTKPADQAAKQGSSAETAPKNTQG